ncbi:hypothetical protein QJS04_geneDACA014545 [Acorus gramineus]|uniref:Uncharacterized protein n=1 Tax=Acorus gramineus TaxID=55184 RepID=A0AAV9AQ03_ACOGR|nr:hypothetical protein QJS04_geneDACA014545 [Acorus gramineus]
MHIFEPQQTPSYDQNFTYMGCSFSSKHTDHANNTSAKVISPDGGLKEYTVPVTVAEVLLGSGYGPTFFICDSNKLYFNERVPAMDGHEFLDLGQIYFVLPIDLMIKRSLTSTDMVALANKASSAMSKASKGRPSVRIVPLAELGSPRSESPEEMKRPCMGDLNTIYEGLVLD